MSSYGYYQNHSRGYGTNQLQFGRPPTPDYRPNPNWGGLDFYQAHSRNADPALFHHAWNRIRDHSLDSGGLGVGTHEARHWHRRLYGGQGDHNLLRPEQLGHAAAYEAFRMWLHHNSHFHDSTRGDRQRQREGLIGLAIGEVTRMLQHTGRGYDQYARQLASEAAAATAAALFHSSREDNYEGQYRQGRSRSRHAGRRGSFSSGGSYSPDPYAIDDEAYSRGRFRRGRSQSRHGGLRHHRSHSRGPPSMMYDDMQSGMPLPGIAGSAMSGIGGGAPGMMPGYSSSSYGSYDGGGAGYGPAGAMKPMGGYPGSMGGMPGGYGGGVPTYATSGGMPMQIPPGVPSSQYSHHGGHRHRSHSMGYGQPQYGSGVSMYPGQPQTIVITQPGHSSSRKHKHRSDRDRHGRSRSRHHRHRSRSRSSDGRVPGQLAIAYPM